MADQAGNAADSAGSYVKRAYDEARDEAEDAMEAGADCTRKHLASGIATAFIGGLIIGFALSRRHRPSFQKQYIQEPMEQAQEMAAALARADGARASGTVWKRPLRCSGCR